VAARSSLAATSPMRRSAHVGGGPPEGLPYGFLWWAEEAVTPRRFLAAGYVGQFVLVVPADDLVVGGTSDASRLSPSWTNPWHLAATLARA
jgi:CubicO group peptidase (beta-lactamase class C family)